MEIAALRLAERDAENELSVLHRPLGVGEECKVCVVDLCLIDEALSFLAGDRRQRPVLDGGGAVLEALDHGVDVELSHTETINPVRP